MKRILLLLAAGALTLSAAQPTSGIKGTFHDLSASGYKTVTNVTQVCIFCHTPHNAAANQIVPLWNHTTTNEAFTMYGGGTAAAGTLAGGTLACLSCHDGTLAVGSIVNTPYMVTVNYATSVGQVDPTSGKIVGSFNVGTDLSNDHPVNVTYPVANAGFVDAGSLANVKLYSGKVECASCHDVHNWGGAGVTGAPFLRVANTNSNLCTACHIK